jgi:hypothetical protein
MSEVAGRARRSASGETARAVPKAGKGRAGLAQSPWRLSPNDRGPRRRGGIRQDKAGDRRFCCGESGDKSGVSRDMWGWNFP